MPEYRGFEYVTRPRGPNTWQWELYERGATIGFDKGEINGKREDAALCAQHAIDRCIEGTSQDFGRKFVGGVNVAFVVHQIKRLERLAKRTPHRAERRVHEAVVAHLKKQLQQLA
jgi:hypothetical protein